MALIYSDINFIEDFELFLKSNILLYKKQNGIYTFENLFSVELLLGDGNYSYPIRDLTNTDKLFLQKDRWYSSNAIVKGSILGRLGKQKSIFARKCKLISYTPHLSHKDINVKKSIELFLNDYHTYSNAKAMFYYALVCNEQIVAAATFSAPRPMLRNINGQDICLKSYEWVRYASQAAERVVGGMGKILKAFEKELIAKNEKYDIMSYSDNEWSAGNTYLKLGFSYIGDRKPIEFAVLKDTYKRVAINKLSLCMQKAPQLEELYRIHNMGSKKFIKLGL